MSRRQIVGSQRREFLAIIHRLDDRGIAVALRIAEAFRYVARRKWSPPKRIDYARQLQRAVQ